MNTATANLVKCNTDLASRIAALRFMVFDFDGVFTDNMVYVFGNGDEAVRCTRADGIGLRRLERSGIEPIILSTETHPVVSARAKKLNVAYIQGVDDKLSVLTRLLSERKLPFSAAGYVGNDINDRPCLQRVGFPIVPADAHKDVLDLACYRTQALGGHGAVREICDLIAEMRGTPRAY